ncbi:hypothetical protein ACFJIV_24135 [Mucilaginibacter sp. UC70_90]
MIYIIRINITVLQGLTVIKQLEWVRVINTSINPNEAKRLSGMSLDELTSHALEMAENFITEI